MIYGPGLVDLILNCALNKLNDNLSGGLTIKVDVKQKRSGFCVWFRVFLINNKIYRVNQEKNITPLKCLLNFNPQIILQGYYYY